MSKSRYYSPLPLDLTVPGIRLSDRAEWDWKDYWTGSMDSLVAAGFATVDMFPGQPGRPSIAVTYRPLDGRTGNDAYWHMVPRYIAIQRLVNGNYSVQVTVSREEQALRRNRRVAQQFKSNSSWESVPSAAVAPVKGLSRSHLRLVWSAPT